MDTAEQVEKYRGTSVEGHFDDPANQHQFVVGDLVYRAYQDRVEIGEVIRIERIRLDGQGNSLGPHPKGKYIQTVAQFGHDYESQTYCWRFFPRAEIAHMRLMENLSAQINRMTRDIAKLEALAEKARDHSAPVFRYDENKRRVEVFTETA